MSSLRLTTLRNIIFFQLTLTFLLCWLLFFCASLLLVSVQSVITFTFLTWKYKKWLVVTKDTPVTIPPTMLSYQNADQVSNLNKCWIHRWNWHDAFLFSFSGVTHLLAWCEEIWCCFWSWTYYIVGCIMFLGDQCFGLPVDSLAVRSSCIPHLQNSHDRRTQNKRRTSFQVSGKYILVNM